MKYIKNNKKDYLRKKYQVGGGLGSLFDVFKDPKKLLSKGLDFVNTAAPQITQTMSGESSEYSGAWGAVSDMTKGFGRTARNAALNTLLPGVGGIIGSGMDLLAGAIDKQKCEIDKTTGEEICYDTNSQIENVGQALLSGDVIGALGTLFGKEIKFDPTTLRRRNDELAASNAQKATNQAQNLRFQQRQMNTANRPVFTAKTGGKVYFKKGGKWMQKVSKSIEEKGTKGKFNQWCREQGFKKTTCECVAKGKKSKDKTTVKRATLAGTFLNCK